MEHLYKPHNSWINKQRFCPPFSCRIPSTNLQSSQNMLNFILKLFNIKWSCLMGILGFLKTICDHNFSLDIKALIVSFLSYIKSWPQWSPHQLYLFGTFHNMEDDEKMLIVTTTMQNFIIVCFNSIWGEEKKEYCCMIYTYSSCTPFTEIFAFLQFLVKITFGCIL